MKTRSPRLPIAILIAGYALLLLHLVGVTVPGSGAGLGFLCLAAVCLLITARAGRPVEETATKDPRTGWNWPVAIVAAFTGIVFFSIGYTLLARAHPAEDALILYRYAEHVAAGRGIVFNPEGPRAEGATDFLWLLMLAAGNAIGLDVAVTALLLNAIGAALLAGFFAAAVVDREHHVSFIRAAVLTLVPFIVVFAHFASAAYVGFSSTLYAALIVWIFRIAVAERSRLLVLLPAMGLALGLFRPDGVVIGVAFTLLGFWRARERGVVRTYLSVMLASGVVGVAYFVWRYVYFGLLLPLPLYVKSRSGILYVIAETSSSFLRSIYTLMPGMQNHLQWLTSRGSPLPTLVIILCLALALRRNRSKDIWRLAIFLIPLALCFAELAFGTLLQNVDFRFQGPITAVLLLVLLQMLAWTLSQLQTNGQRAVLMAAILPILLVQWQPGIRFVGTLLDGSTTRRSYVDMFAPILGAAIPRDTVIVLTEAGRVPYWSGVRVEDATGLNTPRTALTPPTPELLREYDADIVFFHNALTLDFSRIGQTGEPRFVLPVPTRELKGLLRSRFLTLYEEGLRSYEDNLTRPVVPTLLTRYLVDSEAYDVFAVDEERNGTYEHVWAFRKGWPVTPTLLERLEKTGRDEPFRSYLDLKSSSRGWGLGALD